MDKYSYIELIFASDLTTGAADSVFFEYGVLPVISQGVTEDWVASRYTSSKVTEGIPTLTPGERSAMNFEASFVADYNVSGLFVVEREGNKVTISSTQYDLSFEEDTVVVPASVTVTVGTDTAIPFGIKEVAFAEAPLECDQTVVGIETWQQADSYSINGGSSVLVTSNPFLFTLSRGQSFSLVVALGTSTDSQTISTPYRLLPSGITIGVDFLPSGSQLTVETSYPGVAQDLIFTYSMDNAIYQSSNIFPSILPGTYTMYIKDQYNCVTTNPFVVSTTGLSSAYSSLSKSNSIRFKNVIVWGDSANYKNDENTLSCEVDVPVPYTQVQLFQTSDNITIQFRSNYLSNSANVKTIDGQSVYGQAVAQLTNNMGLKDRRDAHVFGVTSALGVSLQVKGIYFTTGNIYNYDTGADIGDYTLNGEKPEWAVTGNFIFVGDGSGNGSWSMITDIVYDQDLQAEVIYTNIPYTGVDGVRNVKSIYNRQNYEVYEFTIDFSAFLGQSIQVEILKRDGTFPDVDFLSERIDVEVRHKNTVDITYSNRTNTDLIFSLGLECRIRVPLEKKSGKPLEETQNYKTDSTVVLISAEIHEADVFTFEPVTKQMMWLLYRALSHSDVRINGVYYVKDQIENNGALGDTNLYEVTATMIKARNVYNTDSGNLESSTGVIEIPALIESGSGFIKYQ